LTLTRNKVTQYAMSDIIDVAHYQHPNALPFDLKFKRKRELPKSFEQQIKHCGLYFIANRDGHIEDEVIYVGIYKNTTGKIIQDRWARHLQTITGRGYNIGFGGKKDPTTRVAKLKAAVSHPNLVLGLENAHHLESKRYFKDTGYTSSPNRLRFASENWNQFSSSNNLQILSKLSFWYLTVAELGQTTDTKAKLKEIEDRVLAQYKPLCNSEYQHTHHHLRRNQNTVDNIADAITRNICDVTEGNVTNTIHIAY